MAVAAPRVLAALFLGGAIALSCSSPTGTSPAPGRKSDAEREATGGNAVTPANSSDPICRPAIDAAGLPHRTELLMRRERESWGGMAQGLVSTGKGAPQVQTVTAGRLLAAMQSNDPVAPLAAAFLAGRCRTGDAAWDGRLVDALRAVLDHEPPARADVRIEAAMSLALRGGAAAAQPALREALGARDPLGGQYKAAFYLAQLGDPSGWGAMVAALTGELVHYRGMAVRHVIGFLPYDGHEVAGQRVDVRAQLVARLKDPEEIVRQEVPFYLEELKPGDLRALLEPVAKTDPSPTVRAAAELVLSRN